jgi:hypothetical protein
VGTELVLSSAGRVAFGDVSIVSHHTSAPTISPTLDMFCSIGNGCNPGFGPSSFARAVFHVKVNAVALRCSVDEKIFQNARSICWRERFFADLAMKQVLRQFGVPTHANQLVK